MLAHTIFPRGADEGDWRDKRTFHRSHHWTPALNTYYTRVHRVNAALRSFARGRPWVRVVDCAALFLKPTHEPADQLRAPNASREHEARGFYIDPALMYDMLHLTPAGYSAWAACLAPAISATLSPGRDAAT